MKPTPQKPIFVIGAFLILLLVTFEKSFSPELAVFTSDNPLGAIVWWHSILPDAWLACWVPDNLVGLGQGQASLQPTALLVWLLPPAMLVNWIYALDILGAMAFFFLFLRQKQCAVLSAMLGAVVYAYCSINFSLVYAGHMGKFGIYCWFAATLWALEHAFNAPKTWSWRIAAGAFLGLTVSEQPDLAILYVLLFVAYLAFRCLARPDAKLVEAGTRFIVLLALSGIVSSLIAANVVLSQYQSQVKGVVELSEENKQRGWDWATQWSYPPGEILELIAPGFYGWKMNEPKGEYWGATGRDADYDTNKKGFARFKLDNSFIGIVPIFLAGAMAVFAFRKRQGAVLAPELRREMIFWAVVAVVTLLLAFGKYFLFYYVFYHIPKMNIIRNPNKFMHLFAISIAILSAHGFHRLLDQREKSWDTRLLWKIMAGIAAVALVAAIYVFASQDKIVARFQPEFDKNSYGIVSTMNESLVRLALSSALFAGLWFWVTRDPKKVAKPTAVPYLVLLLATVDLYLTNRHYVEYFEYRPVYAENHLARFLKSDPEPQRVKILPRDMRAPLFSLYNQWLTLYFPYHRIQTFDTPQISRMPIDYKQYFDAVDSNPLRFWELTNCKYLIGPIEYWGAFQQDPLFKQHFSLAFVYDLANSNKFIVTTDTKLDQITQRTQMVARNEKSLPRVKFYDRWRVITDDAKCLRLLPSREFDPQSEVLVSDPISPQTNAPPATTSAAKVEWLHRSDNVAHLRVTTDHRGVLLFNEKYDPAFVLTIDRAPAQLLRCNFIMKGALVEAGTHEVRFEYRPPRIGIYVSATSWLLCLVGIPLLRRLEKRSR